MKIRNLFVCLNSKLSRFVVILLWLIFFSNANAFAQKISGYWVNKDASYYYKFEANFELNDTVDGYFLWTILASPREHEKSKLGLQGREYVRGTFSAITRELVLKGYRKDDPNSILGLDEYRLEVTRDGQNIFGKTSNGGGWGGRIDSRALQPSKFGVANSVAVETINANGDSSQIAIFRKELEQYEKLFRSRNYLAAVKLLPGLADNGNYLAQLEMAESFWWGYGVLVDKQRAHKFCRMAMSAILAQAEAGSAETAVEARRFYQLGCGTKEDDAVAEKWRIIGIERFLPRAMAGEVDAMDQLANLYGYDYLNGQSKIKEIIWLENAASRGSRESAFQLALEFGPIPELKKTGDPEKSKKWSSIAFDLALVRAKEGDVRALESVAYYYRSGLGTLVDGAEAFRWYEAAAAKGNREAQRVLGSHYKDKEVYGKALAYLNKAAEQGDSTAMVELAEMARDGKGSQKNLELYKQLLKKAANQGHMGAESDLKKLN